MRCLVLSPERTLFEGDADAIVLPAHDGLSGVFPKHAAMIGRLGDGILTLRSAGAERSFLLLGGFYRVLHDTVSILSDSAFPLDEVSAAQGEAEETQTRAMAARTDAERAARDRAVERARLKRRHGRKR